MSKSKYFDDLTLEEMFEYHDHTYMMSDDNRAYENGRYQRDILEDKVKLNNDLKKIILAELPEKINSNTWVDWTKKILEKCDIKPKELYTKLRIILTGKQFGPSMNNLLTLLNVKEIVNRIKVNSE